MPRTVDYYFSVLSPWTYLGHAPFMDLARRHGIEIRWKPVLLGQVFEQTGGVPLAKRHPARQRYRFLELQRWRGARGVPLTLKPAHFPFDPSLADRATIAIVQAGGDPASWLGRAHAGVWVQEENLADRETIARLLDETGYDAPAVLVAAEGAETEAAYARNRDEAIAADVFGAPSWVVDGEVLWGQDRLDLLDAMLSSGRAAYRAE